MLKLDIKKNLINKEKEHFSSFILEPLESTQGITFGNTLRRILFSNTPSLAIYGFKINQANHEFEPVSGIREDILEVSLNLKNIAFSLPAIVNSTEHKISSYLIISGPKIITANFLKIPKNFTRVINPLNYICTITEKKVILLQLKLKIGKGYTLNEPHVFSNNINSLNNLVFLNTNYCPIKNVTYFTNLCYNNNGLLKESLTFNILTNGSLTPTRCLFESFKLLNKNINSFAHVINFKK